jgi:hypothetical protein
VELIKSKKFKVAVILVVIIAVLLYVAYICLYYLFYVKYKACLTGYVYEEGKEFVPLTDSNPVVEGMVLAAENDVLKLYTNLDTTEIAVYDKRTGEIVYSNPVDREKDTIATSLNKVALNSQFALTYYNSTMTESVMYNYNYSVEKGQFEVEAIENGIRYIYLLGNLESPTGVVPLYITEERLNEKVLSKLSERDARTIRRNYIESRTVKGFLELTKGAQSSKLGMQKMNQLFEEAGYTIEDYNYDMKMAGVKVAEPTTFTVPLEYRLVGDKLQVSIPTGRIVETGTGKLAKIDLLCFFGAAGMDEEGYILVPNGSGSLIYFNNDKNNAERYNQYIYGIDEISQSYTVVENTEKARMPVFGIKREKSAIFAEIIDGDAVANIIAGVAGSVNSYNYVYPSFTLRGSEKVSMFGATGVSADLPTLEKDMYDIRITVNYSFLGEEYASYSGMANYYRNELIKRGVLKVKQKESSIPFYLDILGGVKQQRSILGVPYMAVYPMTTFEQAKEIVNAFIEEGITNLRVNYLGWFNGGYYHDVPTKVKIERKLGGKKGLEALNKMLKENGGKLFGDVAFQRISFEADNYNWKMESSQYYSGYVVSLGRVNPATLRQTGGMGYYETNYYVLSPRFLVRHVEKFKNAVERIDISGISLRDLGDVLSPDRKRSNVINRQEAKQIVIKQLELLANTKENIMVKGGNSYSWGYVTDIQGAPSRHNPFYIVDQEVPFYQMVIHGFIDYTGSAINLSGGYDKQDVILRMIEFGSSPYFILSYQDSSEIKYSGLNSLYSTQYKLWLQEAVDIYNAVNRVLKHVANSAITEHKVLNPGVKKIVYDNGCTIYINTNNNEVNVDGVVIPPKDYVLEGVKQ